MILKKYNNFLHWYVTSEFNLDWHFSVFSTSIILLGKSNMQHFTLHMYLWKLTKIINCYYDKQPVLLDYLWFITLLFIATTGVVITLCSWTPQSSIVLIMKVIIV